MKNPRLLFRRITSRLGPLLLLLQRSPVVQMLFPEAKILGVTGAGEAAKWTVATVAGLGAYDSVSGATQIIQTAPQPNSTTVDTAVGASVSFLAQATGGTINPKSWSSDLELPPGLVHEDAVNSAFNRVTGIPTQEGQYTIRLTAWREDFYTGESLSQEFVFNIGPAVITSHPQSTTISSGGSAALSVSVRSGTTPTYQWYTVPASGPQVAISNATSATYNASPTTTTNYRVRVIRGTIVSFSNVATVTISANNTFDDWRNSVFNSTQLANPLISGPDADPDGDGFSNMKEYVFGTAPLTRESSPLSLNVGSTTSSLSFTARAATGAGYAGRTRHYALEKVSNLAAGPWTSPAGFADITGSGQTVNHSENKNAEPTFYRLRVWLTP